MYHTKFKLSILTGCICIQECIDFDYDFQDGFIYGIIFTLAEKDGSEKIWGCYYTNYKE